MYALILIFSYCNPLTTRIPQYNLLRSWAVYLTDNTLTPINQYRFTTVTVLTFQIGLNDSFRATADGQDSANMTNLAIKGLIAIQAMSEISDAVGESSDADSFGVITSSIFRIQSIAYFR